MENRELRPIRHLSDLLEFSEQELLEYMTDLEARPTGSRLEVAKLCFNLLMLRKQENLVNQTESLAKKTS